MWFPERTHISRGEEKHKKPIYHVKVLWTKCWSGWESEGLQEADFILTAGRRQFFWTGAHGLSTHLTQTVPSIKGNSIAWWKRTPGELKRKMYFSKGYTRNFPLFPMPWFCCLPPVQSIFYTNSGQIVSAMWPWQSQTLEATQSTDASRAEVTLALYFGLKKLPDILYLKSRDSEILLRHNSYIYDGLSMMLWVENGTEKNSKEESELVLMPVKECGTSQS